MKREPTLTVGQLIDKLQKLDPALPVKVHADCIFNETDEDVLVATVFDVEAQSDRVIVLADGIPDDWEDPYADEDDVGFDDING